MGAIRLFESLTGYNTSVEATSVYNLGMEFFVTKRAWLTHVWYRMPSSGSFEQRLVRVWEYNPDGTGLVAILPQTTLPAPTAYDVWDGYELPTPYELSTSKRYKAEYRVGNNYGYVYISNYFGAGPGGSATGVVNDFLIAPPAFGGTYPALHGRQGSFNDTSNDFPDASFNSTYYGNDVTVTDIDPNAPVVTYPQIDVLKAGAWARAEILGVGTGTTIRPVELLFASRTIDGGTPSSVSGSDLDGNSPTDSIDGNS